ncbi:MAG TPA: glutaredoxin family protein [Noviherbaspirillum sp.]|nr:glutaredoxin family protein [Noviherbaspirillum sp.]
MKRVLRSCSVLMLLCAASAHAQLYKWVGPDGKVTYSDTPPPKTAARVETKSTISGGLDTSNLPYELAMAVKSHPVTLYTTKDCSACDQGRSLLSSRGIPFTEKTVNTPEDAAQFRQAGGDEKLPLLTIGRTKERGFEASAWNNALTVAGYPASSVLPKSYRNPPPMAAAPQKPAAPKQEEQKKAEVEAPATDLPPATGNAPPGFRF